MKTFFKQLVSYVLKAEARLVLRKYKPQVVAITGSVGKTSTKDAIFAVVASGSHARKSEKSYNSEIGLPLTVLGAPNAWGNPLRWVENFFDGLALYLFPARYPKWLVLEVGADRPGDIRGLTHWLRTDVVVITRLPEMPVHVEFFDSPQALREEKASLIHTLKAGGALVLYADDKEVAGLRARAKDARCITFGFGEDAEVRGSDMQLMFDDATGRPSGMSAHIQAGGESALLAVRSAVGAHALLPALAAVAVGRALGKTLRECAEVLTHYEPPHGRMHLVEGLKNTLIIDDTYNSSPAAAAAALETLELIEGGRKIALLGDMLELGRHSVDEHRKLGAQAAEACDILFTVGFRARDIAQGALDAGMKESAILQFEDAGKAGKELEGMLKENDVILIKGSQSMRMERAVEEVMLYPERAATTLVRQDAEWKRR